MVLLNSPITAPLSNPICPLLSRLSKSRRRRSKGRKYSRMPHLKWATLILTLTCHKATGHRCPSTDTRCLRLSQCNYSLSKLRPRLILRPPKLRRRRRRKWSRSLQKRRHLASRPLLRLEQLILKQKSLQSHLKPLLKVLPRPHPQSPLNKRSRCRLRSLRPGQLSHSPGIQKLLLSLTSFQLLKDLTS